MKKYFLFLIIIILILFTGCSQQNNTTYTAKIINNEIFISLNSNPAPSGLIGPFTKKGENEYVYKDKNGTHVIIVKSKCLGFYSYDYIMMSGESVDICALSK